MKTYFVKRVFCTLQGEGVRSGTRAVFIRFVGCNLWTGKESGRKHGNGACSRWCDTDFVRDGFPPVSAEEVVALVVEQWGNVEGQRWVVLTGGEPLLQVDRELVNALHAAGFQVAVETNGTVDSDCLLQLDWICVSPKLAVDGTPLKLMISGAHELKVVLGARQDWTDAQLHELESSGHWQTLVVQPLDELGLLGKQPFPDKSSVMIDATQKRCLEWVNSNPNWRVGVQLHKVLEIP